MDSYESIDAMNGSTIIHGAHSMLRLKRAIDGELRKSTKPMSVGSMVHCLVLEADEFEKRFCTMPEFENDPRNLTKTGRRSHSKNTEYYDAAKKRFLERETRKVVSSYEIGLAKKVASNIRKKSSARRWITGKAEEAFTGIIAGVPYKGRIDTYGEDWICDVKTCAEFGRDGRKFFFGSHGLKELLYIERMAGYRELFRQRFGKSPEVKIVAAETSGDLDVAVIPIPSVVLDGGYQNLCRLLARYKQCEESGEWPGIDDGQDELVIHQGIVNHYMPDEDDMRWNVDEEVNSEQPEEAYEPIEEEMPF